MLRKILLVLPLAMIVLSSGCTQICIPGFSCGGGTTEYEHDVIVIKSLEALPSTVSPGQQIRVRSYIENRGNRPVDHIEVNLYDYCGGLFSVSPVCPDGDKLNQGKGCKISLLPHQTKSVEWTLDSSPDTKLKTECDLKIYAKYSYVTDSITSVTFINYQEYQKQLDEGTFKPITSYITEGYGPVKPYLTVEDTQPVPVDSGSNSKSTVTFGFQLKNRGSGFVSGSNNIEYKFENGRDGCDIKPEEKKICMTSTKIGSYDISDKIIKCLQEKAGSGLTFIRKETPKIICTIDAPNNINLPKQSTMHVTTQVAYTYEFRKDIKVTIEPKT